MPTYYALANPRFGEGERKQDSIISLREKGVDPDPTEEEKRTLNVCEIEMTTTEAQEIRDNIAGHTAEVPPPTDYFVSCYAPAGGFAQGTTSVTLENVAPGTSVQDGDEVYIHDGVEKPYIIAASASESGGSITLTLNTGLEEAIDPDMPCVIYRALDHRTAVNNWQKDDWDFVRFQHLIELKQATGFDAQERRNIRDQRVAVGPTILAYNKISNWKG